MPNIYPVTQIVIPYTVPAEEQKYVMVQEADSKQWCQPGGGLNPSDYSYLTAGCREINEETGLNAVIDGFIRSYNFISSNGNRILSIVLSARIISGSLKPRDKDILRASAFTLGEIREMHERR